MAEIIAYCGLYCDECPAYIATQKDDDEERKKIAENWSKEFGAEIAPEDINCDGCLSEEGRHIGFCAMCEVRKCGLEREVVNCAYCDEYGCEKLTKFWNMAPIAKKHLEEIRKKL
jgi:hypothetical protein